MSEYWTKRQAQIVQRGRKIQKERVKLIPLASAHGKPALHYRGENYHI